MFEAPNLTPNPKPKKPPKHLKVRSDVGGSFGAMKRVSGLGFRV